MFGWETVDQQLADGLEDLAALHWEEVAGDKDVIPLAPDWDRYRALEKSGVFKCLAARRDGILIGYSWWLVGPSLHYMTTKHAVNDLIFLDPDERRGLAGVRLIREGERALRDLGVVKVIYHSKPNVLLGQKKHTLGDLLVVLGYHLIEHSYAKVLS